MAAGTDQTVALKSDGTVWAWGNGSSGQLGNGSTSSSSVPSSVSGLTGVTSVAAGNQVSMAVRSDGTVWAWGSNAWGAFGTTSPSSSDVPVEVSGLSGVESVAIGSDFAVAMTTTGTIYSWGTNENGQLGNGTTSTSISAPAQVSTIVGTALAAGGTHALVMTAGGTVYVWGQGTSGQLGLGTTTNQTSPHTLTGMSHVVGIAAGDTHSLVLTTTGAVYGFGSNANGQLPGVTGTGTTSPTALAVGPDGSTPTRIAAGGSDSYVETDLSGSYWVESYGSNDHDQLGTTNHSATSGSLTLLADPAPLAAGEDHLILTADNGNADSVGNGALGLLGNGSTSDSASIVAAEDWVGAPQGPTSSAQTTTFCYDGNGVRRGATTSTGTTSFVYDESTSVPEILSNGGTDFVYGPSGEVDEQIDTGSGTPTYLVHDQLGSTRLLTDSSGTVIGTYAYDAYGNEVQRTGPTTTPIGYAGGYTDSSTGLLYLIHRYYDPTTGQFLQVDPLVAQTDQPFSYANDDPVNGSDPSGLAKNEPAGLTPEEVQALEEKAAGVPGYSKADVNSALRKIRQAGKYSGDVNKQKRASNFSDTPPCPALVEAHPYNPAYDPWAYLLPETTPDSSTSLSLWLPGASVARDLGLSGSTALVLTVTIDALAGTAEVGGLAAAGG